MSSPRLVSLLLLPIPLLPLLSVGWRANDTTAEPDLAPLVPHVLPVTNGRCTFEIPADGRSYGLIIGSLARGERSFPVTMRVEHDPSTPVVTPRPFVLRPIDPRLFDVDEPETSVEPTRAWNETPSRRRFHIHVTDGSLDDRQHYAAIDAAEVRRGERVRVFLDDNSRESELAYGLLDEISRVLDEETLPELGRWLGSPLDVDGDGTLAVVLSPWLSKLEGGRTSIDGFVRASDFRADGESPFGDRTDVLYLNTRLRPGSRLRAVLAHECAHAVAISERARREPTGTTWHEEDWLHEAIAHVAEMRLEPGSPNLEHRINRFLESPESTPLVVPDYHATGRWRDHACRGATYTFLNSCVAHDEHVLRRLIHSRRIGAPNLASATGLDFDEAFRRWAVETYLTNGVAPSNSEVRSSLTILEWPPHEQHRRLNVHATANAFVRFASPEPGSAPTKLVVTAPESAMLQLTLIPLDGPRRSIEGQRRSGEGASDEKKE